MKEDLKICNNTFHFDIGTNERFNQAQDFIPSTFDRPGRIKPEQSMFPGPFPPSVTNFSVFGTNSGGAHGNTKSQSMQPISCGTGSPQNLGTKNSNNTLFPKPIDVVALLSGADQFSNRSQTTKSQPTGLPGPMQLFSNLSISEEGGRNIGEVNKSGVPNYTMTHQTDQDKVCFDDQNRF